MKRKSFFIVLLVMGIVLAVQANPLYAQITAKTLTLLYSNNFNGEIEPCPT